MLREGEVTDVLMKPEKSMLREGKLTSDLGMPHFVNFLSEKHIVVGSWASFGRLRSELLRWGIKPRRAVKPTTPGHSISIV